jgi:hypothetical protein
MTRALDEEEGDRQDDYEARHNLQFDEQPCKFSCAFSLLNLGGDQQDTPHDGDKPDQQNRFANNDPVLSPDDPYRVEQFDQDEDQQHRVENRKHRLKNPGLLYLQYAHRHGDEEHHDWDDLGQRREEVNDGLGDSQNAEQGSLFSARHAVGLAREAAFSIGVPPHLRSVSLIRGRVLERGRDLRRSQTLQLCLM